MSSGLDILIYRIFLGIPGQFEHKKYIEAIEKITNAAKTSGKALGCMSASSEWSVQYWDWGFRMFAFGVDSMLLQSALTGGINELKSLSR